MIFTSVFVIVFMPSVLVLAIVFRLFSLSFVTPQVFFDLDKSFGWRITAYVYVVYYQLYVVVQTH